MAYSYKTIYTVVSDGVTKVFTIPYGFLRASFIEVWINDTTKLIYLTDYTMNTAGEVELVSAVAAGATIAIKRNTSKVPLVSWSDASVLLSKDLSLQDTQLLHIQEELSDAVQNDATEAAARATQAAADALAYKNAAKTSEDNAKLSETAADLSELNAKTSEDNAKASETAARASEVAAKASETAAANSAVGAAASQVASANSALAASASETAALASKNAAKTSEDNAKASETAAAGSASGAATSATTATEAAATAVANGGTLALPNHIVKGGKVSATNGLVMTHGFLEAIIERRITYKTAGDTQTLPAKRMGLLTIDKDGNRGTVLATDPTTFIDNNTVGLWKPAGSASCPNLAAGISSIAVPNDLTKAGTIAPADGIFGGDAGQGDGSTGSYSSENTTNFPTGANPFHIRALIEVGTVGTVARPFFTFGAYASNQCCFTRIGTGGQLYLNNYASDADTGFICSKGDKLLLDLTYDGNIARVFASGNLIYSLTLPLSIVASPLQILKDYQYNGNATVHFIELRNKVRSNQEIAEHAAKLLIPVCYDTPTGRKNITVNLPADTISLGMVRTGATGVLAYDDSTWQWGRREKAYGGNRVAIQDYKPVVVATPASMQWTPPFGSGATYRVEWRSAEDTNGKNDYECHPIYTAGNDFGVQSSFYTNGKVGVFVGNGGSTYTRGAWRVGGYIRPIFTLQEDD